MHDPVLAVSHGYLHAKKLEKDNKQSLRCLKTDQITAKSDYLRPCWVNKIDFHETSFPKIVEGPESNL